MTPVFHGLAWLCVGAVSYWLALWLPRRGRRVNAAVFWLACVALLWAALAVVFAHDFRGPRPEQGWTPVQLFVRDGLLVPGSVLSLFTPWLLVGLAASAMARRGRAVGRRFAAVCAVGAMLTAPVGLALLVYTGCTRAGACF